MPPVPEGQLVDDGAFEDMFLIVRRQSMCSLAKVVEVLDARHIEAVAEIVKGVALLSRQCVIEIQSQTGGAAAGELKYHRIIIGLTQRKPDVVERRIEPISGLRRR